jgi:hypothetical protein
VTTTRTVVLTVLAVLAVAAGGLALARGVDGPDSTTGPSALPAAPEGTRWVGMNRVVVAVPDWWTTGETQCLKPVEDTVYFESGAMTDCSDEPHPATLREVSALAVLDGTCCYGEHELRSMTPVTEVDGHQVVAREGCEEWFRGVCRRLFGVPDLGVVFAVTIADEGDGDHEAIRDSVRVLPDGLTTVPLEVGSGFTPGYGTEPSLVDDVVAAVEKAGLQADVTRVSPRAGDGGLTGDLPPGSLLEVSPAPGSVVENGATVTITVLGGQ